MDGTGSHAKGEVQVVAQPIRKEELGGRESDIAFGKVEKLFGHVLGAVAHVMLQVDTALGKSRAA
jgi:hypothetical protein